MESLKCVRVNEKESYLVTYKDVMNITGKSECWAKETIATIRKVLNKKNISVKEMKRYIYE